MIEIIWEFVVKEGARGQFELMYGPGGAWSELFARAPGFRGTTLMRDTMRPQRYLAIDIWDTQALRDETLAEREGEYADLEATLGRWTVSRAELGIFQVRAEATVHPRGRARPDKPGEARRRSHRGG
jgi:heme-degrading monooxygenase HmoA